MISIETLFLRTLADIEQRLSVQDSYEILLIAGLIRKLFLDDYSLVDRVNATHKLKLNFEITALLVLPPSIPPPMLWSIQDGLDPNTSPPFARRQMVSRDQFFKTVVTIVNQHEYSIREVVLFEANIVGAVHAGSPKKEKEHVLHEVDCRYCRRWLRILSKAAARNRSRHTQDLGAVKRCNSEELIRRCNGRAQYLGGV